MKSNREHTRHQCGKVSLEMGRAIQNYSHCWGRSILSEDLDERSLPRPWNVRNLKKFYH